MWRKVMSADAPSAICLYGAGGHGRVVAAQMRAAGLEPLGFIDNNVKRGNLIDDVPVNFNDLNELKANMDILVTIGDNMGRKSMLNEARQLKLNIISFCCPRAISHTQIPIGLGTMVLSGAILNPGAGIGTGVIINTGAVIEHDCQIGDFCHISPNATLAGNVHLGEGVWIGAGAVILPGVKIAPWTIIGAGTVVPRTLDAAGTYIGVPAKRIH